MTHSARSVVIAAGHRPQLSRGLAPSVGSAGMIEARPCSRRGGPTRQRARTRPTAPTPAHTQRAIRAEPTGIPTSCPPPIRHYRTTSREGGATPPSALGLWTLTRLGPWRHVAGVAAGNDTPLLLVHAVSGTHGGRLNVCIVPWNSGNIVHTDRPVQPLSLGPQRFTGFEGCCHRAYSGRNAVATWVTRRAPSA